MDEYINRKLALKAKVPHYSANGVEIIMSEAIPVEYIKNLPAADVRPVVRGHWIPIGIDDMDEGMYKCSKCGSEHFFPDILLGIPADNFCSNCGADMREQSKEE